MTDEEGKPAVDEPRRVARSFLTRELATGVAARLAAVALAGFLLVWLQPILMPLVLALLLAFLLLPLVGRLTGWGLPHSLAIFIAETAATLPVLAVVLVFMATAGPLSAELPKYQDRLGQQIGKTVDLGLERVRNKQQREALRRNLTEDLLPRVLTESVGFFQDSLRVATTAVGYFLLTLLLSAFILVEGAHFRRKFVEAYGEAHALMSALDGIGRDVRSYIVTKTWISALTGLCVWLFLELCGVDFAIFWGLIAFPLNFVPTVGAVVASLPPIIVALVDPELSTALTALVIGGLLAINGTIGSVLDPRFVGRSVKVSPLVVFLSMLVWGLLWGPIGMILAVPIMVSVKVIFARIPALEPVATLMRG